MRMLDDQSTTERTPSGKTAVQKIGPANHLYDFLISSNLVLQKIVEEKFVHIEYLIDANCNG